jgi:hypothetical protein
MFSAAGARGMAALNSLGVAFEPPLPSNSPAADPDGLSQSADSKLSRSSSLTITGQHGGGTSDAMTDVDDSSTTSSSDAPGCTGLKVLQGLVMMGPDGRRKIEEFTSSGGLGQG